ncbi:frataxin homolog, mitochondrial [Anopheles bellator]|uniref:frataxin homolog, mitochondrial n=1 Tax=Anopheles bellator TaxID=139047 RepID=UPI0026490961|nr:frataxin homolog, mitochondrial [Anopheles bellator]
MIHPITILRRIPSRTSVRIGASGSRTMHLIRRPVPSQRLCTNRPSQQLTPNTRWTDQCIAGWRWLSSKNPSDSIPTSPINSATFEAVCSDTLESLCDYFEEMVEETTSLNQADVTYSDGVLTVNFGQPHGTYVINRQSPNRQIWLSSPTSGPKRYDFVPNKGTVNSDSGYWLYRHDGVTLHELLQAEVSRIAGRQLNFLALPHGRRAMDHEDT